MPFNYSRRRMRSEKSRAPFDLDEPSYEEWWQNINSDLPIQPNP